MDPASSIPIGSILLYVLFLLLSAYFAAAETAYTAVSKVRMRTMADKGDKRAKRVLWISDRFDKTLTTILIGNNVFHASCASLSALLVLSKFGEEDVIYGTLLTTFVVYLFAEMIPKSLAKAAPERFALFFTPFISFVAKVFTPITWIFQKFTSTVNKCANTADDSPTLTEEELRIMVDEIEEEGELEEAESDLI